MYIDLFYVLKFNPYNAEILLYKPQFEITTNVLVRSSASFESLCYGSMSINIQVFVFRGAVPWSIHVDPRTERVKLYTPSISDVDRSVTLDV